MDEQELTAMRQRLVTWDEVADQIPEHHSRAAVALCLAPDAGELSILMMRRVEHPKDPWSGQISLPGGREEPEDPSLSVTARRETLEEVGLDLGAEGPCETEELGLLPPIQARSRGGFMDTTIVPFVHLLSEQIRSGELDGHFPYEKKDGAMVHLPCWNFEERCIWGLTFRIVTELMHPKA